MRRRAFLASGLAVATAGCLSDGGGGDDGSEFQNPDFDVERNAALPGAAPDPSLSTRGLAPEPEALDAPQVDVDALPTYDQYEEPVPLLPADAAYAWYRRRDARFVDARSTAAYENSHVTGAVSSPAPDARRSELPDDDPVASWPDGERIVTYCTCPHHLSGQRASELRSQGYEAVFAIDEGFREWVEQDYPTETGESDRALAPRRTVSGRVDARYAGEFVRVRDTETNQVEPGVIADDGSYSVDIHFVDLAPDDRLTVSTPAGTTTGTVAELTDGSA